MVSRVSYITSNIWISGNKHYCAWHTSFTSETSPPGQAKTHKPVINCNTGSFVLTSSARAFIKIWQKQNSTTLSRRNFKGLISIMSLSNTFYEQVETVSRILLSTLKNKTYILAPPCDILRSYYWYSEIKWLLALQKTWNSRKLRHQYPY